MKRLVTYFTMMILALAPMTLTSCDEDEMIADTLWGTWEGNMHVSSYWNDRYYDAVYSEIAFDKDPWKWASGDGYWVDYYSNAPWDYVANHIRWTVDRGNIYVRFLEEGSEIEIYDYYLDDGYFCGYIYADNGNKVQFRLRKTSSPDWDDYHYGWSYWGAHTRSADNDSTSIPRRVIR